MVYNFFTIPLYSRTFSTLAALHDETHYSSMQCLITDAMNE